MRARRAAGKREIFLRTEAHGDGGPAARRESVEGWWEPGALFQTRAEPCAKFSWCRAACGGIQSRTDAARPAPRFRRDRPPFSPARRAARRARAGHRHRDRASRLHPDRPDQYLREDAGAYFEKSRGGLSRGRSHAPSPRRRRGVAGGAAHGFRASPARQQRARRLPARRVAAPPHRDAPPHAPPRGVGRQAHPARTRPSRTHPRRDRRARPALLRTHRRRPPLAPDELGLVLAREDDAAKTFLPRPRAHRPPRTQPPALRSPRARAARCGPRATRARPSRHRALARDPEAAPAPPRHAQARRAAARGRRRATGEGRRLPAALLPARGCRAVCRNRKSRGRAK